MKKPFVLFVFCVLSAVIGGLGVATGLRPVPIRAAAPALAPVHTSTPSPSAIPLTVSSDAVPPLTCPTPAPILWMNDPSRASRKAWDLAHANQDPNVAAATDRPQLTKILIGDQSFELGARPDGVVVWKKFEE